MDPRPTVGGAAGAAPAGCQDIKQVLYESSKKSEISEQELQEIFAKLNMGADPNKKLSEEDARALRNIIDGWKVRGEELKLPSQESQEKMFITEFEKRCEEFMEAEAAKEQAIARKERILAKIMGSYDEEPPQPCEVCMKVDHWSLESYLDEIPDPENTTAGKDYEIRCRHCNKSDHGHPDGSWPGSAWKKGGFWTTPDERDSDIESDD